MYAFSSCENRARSGERQDTARIDTFDIAHELFENLARGRTPAFKVFRISTPACHRELVQQKVDMAHFSRQSRLASQQARRSH